MVGTFVALALGQLLIGGADVEGAAPFNAIVALFAVALAMVSATRAEPPRIAASAHLPYRHLSRSAPVAVAGSALSGLISGAFYALAPAWLQGEGADSATIAVFMLAAVLGGLAFHHHRLILRAPPGRDAAGGYDAPETPTDGRTAACARSSSMPIRSSPR
jgi:hypothetical protein